MKLRLQGNALRLRLSRSEVERFHQTGRVEEAMQFPGGAALTWSLQSSSSVVAPQVLYKDSSIHVLVPATQASLWALSNEVGIYCPADSASPALSIEKDFQCLHEAPSLDAFPNPASSEHPK